MTQSLWSRTALVPSYPRLDQDDLHVDVAVVGGGITGVTLATLLKLAGKRVALLEARSIAGGVTGGTTAHLTEALDTRYYELESKFGQEGARLAAASTREAIELIAELTSLFKIDCGFERLPGYLYTERDEHVDEIERELEAAKRAGVAVETSTTPLPLVVKRAIRFAEQAQFHPVRYVAALAERLPGAGSHVFEGSRVVTVEDGEPCRLHLEHGATLTADSVALATHAPLNRVLLQTKVAHYRSYVVSGPVALAPHGLFFDTEDPYHYIRSFEVDGVPHLIVGGEDHKTGHEEDTEAPFRKLALYANRLGLTTPSDFWSAQVIEPVDGLPFIGRNSLSEHVWVATGFSGNGMTFGTIAAKLIADHCLEIDNPYASLYAATRMKPVASLASFIEENVDFPLHLVSDAFRPPQARSLDEVAPGEGKIVRIGSERQAVYRDPSGRLHAVSPVCTHLGCEVAFNPAEKTWDCPCHGSRFDVEGGVIDGPAVRPLAKKRLDTAAE